MKAAFHTLGCKVNQYETESIREDFIRAGYEIAEETEKADVCVINTCTVTSLADRKSRQFIRRMKHLNPDAVIVVTGCYAQTSPEEAAAACGADIVCGTNEKQNITGYVEKMMEERAAGRAGTEKTHVLPREELAVYSGGGAVTSPESRTRALVKIEEGCDRFCSYCVIPYARGSVRSRPEDEILEEIRILSGKGFREMILTGINTALYDDLERLLGRIEDLPGDFRIRLSSLEPTVINSDYVKKLFPFERLCRHLHLSLQSGSDRVLSAMRRRYTMEDYRRIVGTLRDFDPLYGISTDIIAGFPGETEEDIAESVRAVGETGFTRTHVFGYSKRPGTPAAEMPGQIAGSVKKRRVRMLIEAGGEAAAAFAAMNEGSDQTVIFEEEPPEPGDGGKRMMSGYAGNYLRVYAPYDERCLGELTRVRIGGPLHDGAAGTVI